MIFLLNAYFGGQHLVLKLPSTVLDTWLGKKTAFFIYFKYMKYLNTLFYFSYILYMNSGHFVWLYAMFYNLPVSHHK